MPDNNTEGISNLRLVNRVEKLMQKTNDRTTYLSPGLEALMFSDPNYLENNVFSTSHQSVNVYSLPEKRYEVRTEENAVDVQIHREVPKVQALPSNTQAAKARNNELAAQKALPDIESEALSNNIVENGNCENKVKIQASGACNGFYTITSYKGKLKNHTIGPVVNMFIPQMRLGKERLVPVSVDEEERIIYISKENYKIYEKELKSSEIIELRRLFFN